MANEWWQNADRGRYENPANIDQTMGTNNWASSSVGNAANYYPERTSNQGIASPSLNVPQHMRKYFSDSNQMVYPGQRSPHEGFEEMQFSETAQAPEKKGFIKNILDNTIIGKFAAMNDATNPNAFNYNPNLRGQIDYMKDLGGYGVMDASGLNKITRGTLKGKNLQSLFGTNDLQQMLSNQLGKYEKTYANLDKQWGNTLSDEELQAKKERYFKKFIEPARIEQENQIAAQKKATADAIAAQRQGTRAADTRAGAFRDTVQLDPRGGGGPGGGTWRGQTAAKERQGVKLLDQDLVRALILTRVEEQVIKVEN